MYWRILYHDDMIKVKYWELLQDHFFFFFFNSFDKNGSVPYYV